MNNHLDFTWWRADMRFTTLLPREQLAKRFKPDDGVMIEKMPNAVPAGIFSQVPISRGVLTIRRFWQ